MSEGVWRWNVDVTWHSHASMVFAAHNAKTASTRFGRYYHSRSCLYFAVNILESALNKEMRTHLERQGADEQTIISTLRGTYLPKKPKEGSLSKKLRGWPRELFESSCAYPEEQLELFASIQSVRNEVTHPKARDHAIYEKLDAVSWDVDTIVNNVSLALVKLACWGKRPFDYWFLGWNYVGLSGNYDEPTLENNGNCFIHSLKAMGFRSASCDGKPLSEWEQTLMTSVEGYELLVAALRDCPLDIEPFQKRPPPKSRLCRYWWDKELIIRSR